MRIEPDPADFHCPEDPSHPLRVLRDEERRWAPGEEPIVICCTCGCDAEPKSTLPPLPWTVKGSRIYAADGEEVAVATKASPKHRANAEATAAAIVVAVNATAAPSPFPETPDPRVTPYAPSPEHVRAMDWAAEGHPTLREIRRRVTDASAAAIKANDTYPDGDPRLREAYAKRAEARNEARAAGMAFCPWCGGSKAVRLNIPGAYGVCADSFHNG